MKVQKIDDKNGEETFIMNIRDVFHENLEFRSHSHQTFKTKA